jgi:hypothetical protein
MRVKGGGSHNRDLSRAALRSPHPHKVSWVIKLWVLKVYGMKVFLSVFVLHWLKEFNSLVLLSRVGIYL